MCEPPTTRQSKLALDGRGFLSLKYQYISSRHVRSLISLISLSLHTMFSSVVQLRALAARGAPNLAKHASSKALARPVAGHSRLASTDAAKSPMTLPSFSMQNKVGFFLYSQRGLDGANCDASQVCLVTGAARGLGNEFCRAFVESYVSFAFPSLPTP